MATPVGKPHERHEGHNEQDTFEEPRAQRTILVYAVLGGLTPLVPLPYIDDLLLSRLQQRMVVAIADAHSKKLSPPVYKALGTESSPRGNIVVLLARKLAFVPIKRLFRKALFLWVAKDIVDLTSRTYHVGLLVDFAMTQPWFSAHEPSELRAAMDRACEATDTSPIRRAFSSVFKESGDLLGEAVKSLRDRMLDKTDDATTGSVASKPPVAVADVVDRLQRALQILPPAHFAALRVAFAQQLGEQASRP